MTALDTGTAYDQPVGTHDAQLTEVGRSTPTGELLRRYWQPVGPNPFGGAGRGDALGFILPVDDTTFRIFTVLRAKDTTFFDRVGSIRASGEPTDPLNVAFEPGAELVSLECGQFFS